MIDPRHMTVREWCDAQALQLFNYGSIPTLESDEAWPEWANAVIMLPRIAAFIPPSPEGFTDWRTWAERFLLAVPI